MTLPYSTRLIWALVQIYFGIVSQLYNNLYILDWASSRGFEVDVYNLVFS